MYQISEVSKLVGLSIPTIRYYEKLGLINTPIKNARGYKEYDEQIIQYLGFIVYLRDTEMPLDQIKTYIDAYKRNDYSTCYSILQGHEKRIELELRKRLQILEKVQYKISHFSNLKGGGK